MSSEATLSEAELVAAAATVAAHAALLKTKTSLVGAALDLVDEARTPNELYPHTTP